MLLALLCVMSVVGDLSPQWFERVQEPTRYAQMLRHHAGWLRAIVLVDDVFIAAYVVAGVSLAAVLAVRGWSPLPLIAAAGAVAAGVLDLAENHHILGLLGVAELELTIPVTEVLRRAELSQLKWMVAHVSFVAAGVAMPRSGRRIARLLRGSLIGVQLPIGAAAWVVVAPGLVAAVGWARLLAFVVGFALIAWIYAAHDVGGEAETGVPG